MKQNISVIIIAGNEESVISDCLKSILWADEIVLVAANSSDNTKTIALNIAKSKLKIISTNDEYNKNFSKWRNLGLKSSSFPWILYVDSDERVSLSLSKEITKLINSHPSHNHYAIPRFNYYLGKRVKHGGSYPDYVKRLFLKKDLQCFTGQLHEEPNINGQIGYLRNAFVHLTHRNLFSMLQKTIAWTDLEAKELFLKNHPPVVWWRFLRMMMTKLFHRLIVQSMWRDGLVGWISAIFETYDTFIIYSRLWEIQQNQQIHQKE